MARYSQKKIRKLIQQSDNASTADKKGDKLEELAKYLFGKIRGVTFYGKNILDGNRAQEIDVVFWNLQNVSDLCFLDAILIVECKNLCTPVSSSEVGWFVRKLQDRGAACGLLIILGGITGSQDGTSNAHSEVLSALTRDGIKIIILTRHEILSLRLTYDLIKLIREKLLNLTLRKTVVIDQQQ